MRKPWEPHEVELLKKMRYIYCKRIDRYIGTQNKFSKLLTASIMKN